MAHNRNYKPEDIAFLDQVIKKSDLVSEMKSSYIDYAMSVIVDRALPDVRDGLKPVHRRILYTLFEDGLTADKPFKKSATCVGDVLGRYHPHGDASVYDAMVRLAQDFSMRYPLVDGHGNFGSVDGDPAAAYRYTEARLSKISDKLLEDINKDSVDWIPNFDESLQEPMVLPSRFPNLLVNGSQGIAVGMTTNIPPHNLSEVIDTCICVLDNPEATLDDMMKYIKGPDFPTKGVIMGRSGIRQAYATGRGKITIRAKTEFEEFGRDNRTRIIVNELPYLVKKRDLVKKIADAVKEKRIEGISDLRDESDRNGMRIVIELKRDANAQIVLNRLFAQTAMQSTFGVIMRALVDDQKQPRILTLKEVIDEYLAFQKQVIRRRTQFDLNKALERSHLLEGLIIAQDNIDEVIKIIRSSFDDAKERLMARFDLDDVQSQAILDMRLKALQGLDRAKLEEEFKLLQEKIEYYNQILSDNSLVVSILKEELLEIKEKFGDERKTQIVNVSGEVDYEDLIPVEDCVLTLTDMGYIKRTNVDDYRQQGRGGKGVIGVRQREEDEVKILFTCSTHDYIMFFTNLGRTYRIKGYEVPLSSRTSKGTNVINVLPLSPDENVTAMITVPEFNEEETLYLLMTTKHGIIKRTELNAYKNIRKTGINAITLDEGDELGWVRLSDGNSKIIVAAQMGKAICFKEDQARVIGRTARGVRAIKLVANDVVVGMDILDDEKFVLTVSESGLGRLTKTNGYPIYGRAGKGQKNFDHKKYGNVVNVQTVSMEEDLILISANGMIVRIPLDQITPHARGAKGVKVMNLAEDDRVISAVTVAKEDDNGDEEIVKADKNDNSQDDAVTNSSQE